MRVSYGNAWALRMLLLSQMNQPRDLTPSQLSILPSQIFYNRLAISGTPLVIARREIFDIRTQLMAEDNENYDNAELIAGLEEGDLKPNFYEGGFKTWECALDLAKVAAGDSPIVDSLNDAQADVHIIEVCIIVRIKHGYDAKNVGNVAGCRYGCAIDDFVRSYPWAVRAGGGCCVSAESTLYICRL